MQEALMMGFDDIPLVIVKGAAGTAKNILRVGGWTSQSYGAEGQAIPLAFDSAVRMNTMA